LHKAQAGRMWSIKVVRRGIEPAQSRLTAGPFFSPLVAWRRRWVAFWWRTALDGGKPRRGGKSPPGILASYHSGLPSDRVANLDRFRRAPRTALAPIGGGEISRLPRTWLHPRRSTPGAPGRPSHSPSCRPRRGRGDLRPAVPGGRGGGCRKRQDAEKADVSNLCAAPSAPFRQIDLFQYCSARNLCVHFSCFWHTAS
jgi:hypothetical protein